MKTFIKSSCLLFGLSLALIPTIASAQFSNAEGGDVFKRAATGDTGGLLNLMNQVQINGKINPNYSSEQREQIKSATEDFRALQMQALKDRNKKAIVTPVVEPSK
jgi:ribosomal protein RSM22 (predicted rRNA methylase)